jgi:hypothetical protein
MHHSDDDDEEMITLGEAAQASRLGLLDAKHDKSAWDRSQAAAALFTAGEANVRAQAALGRVLGHLREAHDAADGRVVEAKELDIGDAEADAGVRDGLARDIERTEKMLGELKAMRWDAPPRRQ